MDRDPDGSVESLRAILAGPETESEPTPAPRDAAPRARAAAIDDDSAEDEEDDGPLTPEERVAEAVRQDREARGEDEEDDDEGVQAGQADPADPSHGLLSDEELEQLRAKAARADELDEEAAYLAATREERELVESANREWEKARQHYRREFVRAVQYVDAEAQKTLDPDAYKAMHMQASIDNVFDAWDAWQRNQAEQVGLKQQALREQRERPLFADFLIEQLDLPNHPAIKEKILRGKTPEDMEERANDLKAMQDQLAAERRANVQVQSEAHADRARLTQVHASSGGRPPRRKPVEYSGSVDELRAIERLTG